MFESQNRVYMFHGGVNTQHNFRIMFNDGTEIMATGTMKTDSSSYYLLLENKAFEKKDSARYKKIRPSETKYIFRTDIEGGGEYKGIATDSCWLFEKIEGVVNAYTPLPEDFVADSLITYLQKGDTARLVKMSGENISDVLGGDEKALKLAKKKRYIKAIAKYNDDSINELKLTQ